MPTYFLSIAYKGTRYAGFQVQDNALTIQGEVERVLEVYLQEAVKLTGSSRTDTGVHAHNNYFHFQIGRQLDKKILYNLNAMLPHDIALTGLEEMREGAHCRFDATSRRYHYHIHNKKDPFLADRAWFVPYPLSYDLMNEAAGLVMGRHDFTSFAKKNTQVANHFCTILTCRWEEIDGLWKFSVEGNRFLRGMVRGLVGTMVKIGRKNMSIDQFKEVLKAKDNTMADFTAPAHGLFLEKVVFPYDLGL